MATAWRHGDPDDRPRRPSGASAIAAGVLTVLTGLWHVVGLVAGIFTVADGADAIAILIGIGCNAVIAGITLFAGAAVLARKPAGRVATVLGCALAITMYLFLALRGDDGLATGSGAAALVIVGVPALAAIVLALLASTGRWLAWDRPVVPPPSYQPSMGAGYRR